MGEEVLGEPDRAQHNTEDFLDDMPEHDDGHVARREEQTVPVIHVFCSHSADKGDGDE